MSIHTPILVTYNRHSNAHNYTPLSITHTRCSHFYPKLTSSKDKHLHKNIRATVNNRYPCTFVNKSLESF